MFVRFLAEHGDMSEAVCTCPYRRKTAPPTCAPPPRPAPPGLQAQRNRDRNRRPVPCSCPAWRRSHTSASCGEGSQCVGGVLEVVKSGDAFLPRKIQPFGDTQMDGIEVFNGIHIHIYIT